MQAAIINNNKKIYKAPQSHVNLSPGRLPIPPGVVGMVAHVADGSTKSETTPARHLSTSGDRPLGAVIVDERRDGPRWLCNDDDDDECILASRESIR